MSVLATVLADLRAEGDALDAVVAELPAADWARPTPAEGWTVAHQIAHLAWTDELGALSTEGPEAFRRGVADAVDDPSDFVEAGARAGLDEAPAALLHRWRSGRRTLAELLSTVPSDTRLPWFGPPMAPTSLATARLMETWAHGLDVRDALGVPVESTPRLRHVAHLGVRTRGFSFRINGRTPPEADVRVELTGPDGTRWEWGAPDAADRISGPALDFCLLVTQRRHLDDLALDVIGPVAHQWAAIAQTFAGPPGKGRTPTS